MADASAAAAWLDAAPIDEARDALFRCCGSRRWVEAMLARHPFGSAEALAVAAAQAFCLLEREDYLDAFAQHPPIGGDLAALRARFTATHAWSSEEQSGVASADEATLAALREENELYLQRFGYVFLINATGKTAAQVLAALRRRIGNDPLAELAFAAVEQAEITELRLEKLGR
jgi:2-oxo-4-hydroxy-4-carboxy-5-ureidoimidazoline decarboxylase